MQQSVEVRLIKNDARTSSMFDATQMCACPDVAFNCISDEAKSLLQEDETLRRIVYIDDEGDACTLTAASVADALDFAEIVGTSRILAFTVETSYERQHKTELPVSQWCPVNATVTHSNMKVRAISKEMDNDVVAWVDRPDYIYQNVPEEMKGATLYSFLHKPVGGGHFTVEASAGATIFIFSEAHRDGGFPNLGWEKVEVGRFSWQDGATTKSRKWGLSAWKKIHDGSPLIVPTVSCLVGGIAIAVESSIQETAQKTMSEPDLLMKVLSDKTTGLDIRDVLPKLAQAALAIINEMQIPSLFSLLDLLDGLSEGRVDVNDIHVYALAVVEVVRMLSDGDQKTLRERALLALTAVVEELRKQPQIAAHSGYVCDGCGQSPIVGQRFRCLTCADYDLCALCYSRRHMLHANHDAWNFIDCKRLVAEAEGQAPSLGDELEALPGVSLNVDGKEYYAPGDRGRVCTDTYVTKSDGIERFEVTWFRTGLVSTMKTGMWLKNFRWMEKGIKEPTLGNEVEALPGVSLNVDGKEYYAPGDRGKVCKDTYVTESDGIKRFEVTWFRTGLTSTMKTGMWLKSFRWIENGIKEPSLGDEVEALPGVSLNVDGKEYYAPGDRGRVCKETYLTESDGIKRFEVIWFRTGLISTMKTGMWLNNFCWMEKGIKEPSLGDEVEALPGVSLNVDGKEYYAPGDRGRVSVETYVTESDGIKRLEVTWYRTGLTSTMKTEMWLKNFHWIEKGIKELTLGDEVETLPGVSFNVDGKEYYAPGDRGRVCRDTYVTESDGIERFEVTWYRTGLTSTMKTGMWLKNFRWMEKGIKEPNLDDEVEALPGVSLNVDGKEYYAPGDRGRVSVESHVIESDGIKRFEVRWFRTGLTSSMKTEMWLKSFRWVAPVASASQDVRTEEKSKEMDNVSNLRKILVPEPRSATVLHSAIAINPQVDHFSAVGDVSAEYAELLATYPHLQQAFCLGQVHISHALPSASFVAKVVVTNDGAEPWPEMTAIQSVAGPGYGFPHMQLAPLVPGEVVEIVMDFTVGQAQEGESARSTWAFVDGHGQPFGALMLLEIVRV